MPQRAEVKRSLLRVVAVISISIMAGFILLCLVYCIPTGMMVDGSFDAAEILAQEGLWPLVGFRALDNFTDAIMLNTASYYEDANIVKRAAEAYRGVFPETDPVEAYIKTVWGAEGVEVESYSRYWHGYLVFLKPLYALFNYSQIRDINMVVQFSLFLAISVLLNKTNPRLLIPFVLCVMLLGPATIYKSLQYSSVYYVMLFSVLLFLWNPGKMLSGKNVIWFFLIIGILTVYLDFLTYPIATLTIPLVLLCYREKDEEIKKSLQLVMLCAVMWGIGYALMWIGKWVIAWISAPDTFSQTLISQIKLRSASTSDGSSRDPRFEIVIMAFSYIFMDYHWSIAIAVYFIICLIKTTLNIKYVKRKDLNLLFLLIVPFLCSMSWMLVLANHTKVHILFTYRTAVPMVFCVLTFLSELAETTEKEKLRGSTQRIV